MILSNYEKEKAMKKLLSLLLAVIMLLSVLMLTSCDPIGSVKAFVNKILGREAEVRTTITAEEFNKFTNLTNFTLKSEVSGVRQEMISSGDAVRVIVEYDILSVDVIVDLRNYTLISESELGCFGVTIGEELISAQGFALKNLGLIGVEYNELAYNSETKAYEFKDNYKEYELYFENGNLVYGLITSTSKHEQGTYEITNVGTTTVEIPEVYIDISDGKIEPSQADRDVVTTVTDEQILSNIINMTNVSFKANAVVGDASFKVTDTSVGFEFDIFGINYVANYITIIDGALYEISEHYNSETHGYDFIASPMGVKANTIAGALEQAKEYLSTEYMVYNEEGRYYELEADEIKFYLYFENGQLVQFVACVPYSDMEIEMIFTICDIGNTTIEFPEYTIR